MNVNRYIEKTVNDEVYGSKLPNMDNLRKECTILVLITII